MSIVVRYNPSGLTRSQYDATMELINERLGDEVPAGSIAHVCFGEDGDLHVSEIWESRETWEAFGARLMPWLAEAGVDPGQPQVFEVHNLLLTEQAGGS